MKIVRENINFERGDPRKTLGLNRDKLEDFPDVKSFLKFLVEKIPDGIDFRICVVQNEPRLTWLSPINSDLGMNYQEETTHEYFILFEDDQDGLSLHAAEVKKDDSPHPFEEVHMTVKEWNEEKPPGTSFLLGWMCHNHEIKSVSQLLSAIEDYRTNPHSWDVC